MRADAVPALDALFVPFDDGRLPWVPGRTVFLHAREGASLHARDTAGLACQQGFKPAFDALQRGGLDVVAALDTTRRFDTVLMLPPRQRIEARASFARAIALLAPGGRVVVAARNDEGARSVEADLARIAGPVAVSSKHKCRVLVTAPLDSPVDADLAAQWRDADMPCEVAATGLHSRPGVFAWDRIDPASQLLVDHLPRDLRGRVADLGAGWGFLSHVVLANNPGVVALDAFEADHRAVDLARANLTDPRATVHWHDVTAGVETRYDAIVCNPPFHAQSGNARVDIGRRFIEVARDALAPRGRLWLVANRQLAYEDVLGTRFASVRIVVQAHGFKIIEAART